MTIRRLIAPLTVAFLAIGASDALAQGAFPAPLPGQGQAGTANDPAFPPVNGRTGTANDPAFPPVNGGGASASLGAPASSPFPTGGAPPIAGGFAPPQPQAGGAGDDCMKGFLPLRQDAEKRGQLIKAASDRHAPPDEACKLIGNFSKAEIKMIDYVQSHTAKCGIPPQVSDQLKKGHTNTETMLKKVCAFAQQAATQQRGPAAPTLSDVLGSSASMPEATPTKKGGSTFDTLNGNVLSR